jgi:hypothetical protein
VNVIELKQAVDQLTPDERLELAAYLRWRTQKDNPFWQAELGRRLNTLIAGRGRSRDKLQQLHNKLSAEGR